MTGLWPRTGAVVAGCESEWPTFRTSDLSARSAHARSRSAGCLCSEVRLLPNAKLSCERPTRRAPRCGPANTGCWRDTDRLGRARQLQHYVRWGTAGVPALKPIERDGVACSPEVGRTARAGAPHRGYLMTWPRCRPGWRACPRRAEFPPRYSGAGDQTHLTRRPTVRRTAIAIHT